MSKQDNSGAIGSPAVITFLPLGLGIALHSLYPLGSLLQGWLPLALGLPILTLGVALNIWSNTIMMDAGTSTAWNGTATAVITAGPYRFSRNPQYLSATMIYLGVALTSKTLWALAFLPIVLVVMTVGVIQREERYMQQKFGEAYVDYKRKVRRWI